jgi:hypothetical protein
LGSCPTWRPRRIARTRIDGPLLLQPIWERLGIAAVLNASAALSSAAPPRKRWSIAPGTRQNNPRDRLIKKIFFLAVSTE